MAGRTADVGPTVLRRAAALLGAFSAEHSELSLAELSERTQLPRSTAHRIATELIGLGFLSREAGRYRLATGLWELGELAPVSLRLRETALPHLQTLYEATGENVHLAVLDGAEALYVARVTGTTSIPTVTRMGGRLPLHTTGVGKALLATRDEEWLREYFRHPLAKETVHSIIREDLLRLELDATRRRGYAMTRGEMTLGNVSIAAALPETQGLPRAAVGVVTHLARIDEARIAPLVMRTAAVIGEALKSH
ncbi:MAG: IclR family transcriptional regulator [Actinomycetota bacterium]|nr:IclR family transcriptional regulator [Actinomycetota bacterium]